MRFCGLFSRHYLTPVWERLHTELLSRDVLHADETTLQVLHEEGKKAQSKSYLWLYRTSGDTDKPIVLCEYQPSRSGENVRSFLSEFKGYLHTDGYTETEEVAFLNTLKKVANTFIAWAHKCSEKALAMSETVENKEYKENLKTLSRALLNVPENKPSSFYEAVLTIYVCFSADPDSVGTLDRYLRPFYEKDIESGAITREEAKEYLQELFLMLQAATKVTSPNFTRGGESRFCIGGYLPDGNDGYDELSQLILESLLELPTNVPQVTLRWTAKTPKEAFRFVLDCERKDPHKRIAFQNDEKRIKCYTEICGFPFEKAVGYTTAGCNEPAFLGAITGGNSHVNFARSTETLFHKKSEKIINTKTFEEFYEVFLEELFSALISLMNMIINTTVSVQRIYIIYQVFSSKAV